MYCQKCGADNLENAAMCQSCGGVFVYSQPSKTSGMAITSMILGISGFSMLGVFGITWIIGLVLGIIALSRIGKSGGMLRGKGFAITGIATSAVGLAIVLTIIGVGLFVSSAKTISLSRKLKMYDKIMTSAETDQKPTVSGWVCILKNKAEPQDKCSKALFLPEQFKNADLAVIIDMECGQDTGEPVKASWAFAGTENGADSYVFKLTVPIDEKKAKAFTKTIAYDGKEQVIFEDGEQKIFISPRE